MISPADTGLVYTTVTARVSYAMGRNDNAPRKLAASRRAMPEHERPFRLRGGDIILGLHPGAS